MNPNPSIVLLGREISAFLLMGIVPAIALGANWVVRITLVVPLTHAQNQ